jgi:two-component system OmpR family response regulator
MTDSNELIHNADGDGRHAAGLSILIVEDDLDTAESMAILLRLDGHRVYIACDGAVALELVAKSRPDVALIDIGLPRMDGYTLAKKLREKVNGRRPLMIAVTGYGHEEDRKKSLEAGIDLHLLKPADPSALLAMLKRFEQTVKLPSS